MHKDLTRAILGEIPVLREMVMELHGWVAREEVILMDAALREAVGYVSDFTTLISRNPVLAGPGVDWDAVAEWPVLMNARDWSTLHARLTVELPPLEQWVGGFGRGTMDPSLQ